MEFDVQFRQPCKDVHYAIYFIYLVSVLESHVLYYMTRNRVQWSLVIFPRNRFAVRVPGF